MILRAAERWGQTLRHHRPEQLVRRLWNRARDRLPPPRLADELPRWRDGTFALTGLAIPAGAPRLAAADLARGRLPLLNMPFDFWNEPWGASPKLPALAAFHLHYMEYLLPLASDEPELAARWMADWADQFPHPVRGPSWHPYVISRRLPVWLRLLRTADLPGAAELARSAARQARWLARRFERDLGGNHLWDNARALAIAGCAFAGNEADGWLRRGCRILAECLDRQLLPSGEHEERTPMYQADLARGLREAAAWLWPADGAFAARCEREAARMSAFLDGLRHADGGLPLLSDTTLDGNVPVRPTNFGSGWHGDYYIHRPDAESVLIFDAGALGPADLPAHAHADLLNAEISVAGRRLLVDSGTFAYAGPRRGEFRGTAAHNVLRVEGEELADVWGSFRMGRRGVVVEREAGLVDGGRWVRASHNAYRHRGVRVERLWFLAEDGPWFSVHVAHGGEGKRLEEFLHWHPDASWRADGAARRSDVGGIVWESATPLGVATAQGSYSPRFSVEERNEIWTLTPFAGEAMMAWALTPGRAVSPAAWRDGAAVRFEWTDSAGRRQAAAAPLAPG